MSACDSAQYSAADGSPMVCKQKIIDLQWSAQGHSFTTIVGILPLKCVDMILGQDWLECSPMWVHWGKKLMKFTRNGTRIHLQGVTSDLTKCSLIFQAGLKALMKRQAISNCIQFRLTKGDEDG